MNMQRPRFWDNPPERPGLRAKALWPASKIFDMGGRLRRLTARPYRSKAAVICVGNLIVGGAGKTPTVLTLCERLIARGATPHVLSRGYGGSIEGPHLVDPTVNTADEVGDEPLILAQIAPTWVGRDRVAGAKAAEAAGATVLVMDDGFQNPSLMKDLSLIVIDAGYGHGNGQVVPAGPLREPLETGFARAHAVVLVGEPQKGKPAPYIPEGLPVLKARVAPRQTGLQLKGQRVVAFAGIGRPQKFFQTLKELGAEIVSAQGFGDHASYSKPILKRLEMEARTANAMLITTEKDAARLPKWFAGRAMVLPVALGFSEPGMLDRVLDRLMERLKELEAEAQT